MCSSCHAHYHHTCSPVNEETLLEFMEANSSKKPKEKHQRRYKRRKYESSPLYSKIKIRNFKIKPEKKVEYRPKYRPVKRKRRPKHLNPIYLCENLGCDEWSYSDKVNLEKEVLGDY